VVIHHQEVQLQVFEIAERGVVRSRRVDALVQGSPAAGEEQQMSMSMAEIGMARP